jgi:cardiolipin synthase A/B
VRYRHALLLAEHAGEVPLAIAELRRVAPTLESLLVVARLPAAALAMLYGKSPTDLDPAAVQAADGLRESAAGAARSVDVQLAPELDVAALTDLAVTHDVDLVVAASRTLRSASLLGGLRDRLAVAVLWPASTPSPAGPLRNVLCAALGRGGRASLVSFLRAHADPSLHVTVLASDAPAPDEVGAFLNVAAIHAPVEVSRSVIASLRGWLGGGTSPGRALDLVVLTRMPPALLLNLSWPAPVLLLPAAFPAGSAERALDVTDLIDDGGPVRARVDLASLVGALPPAADEALAFVLEGRVVARAVTTASGEVELPAGLAVTSLGVLRAGDDATPDVTTALDCVFSILRPGGRPLVLYDAELPDDRLLALHTSFAADESDPELLAVRLRPTRSTRAIKERLRALSLPPVVVDARAVLDEGAALDVSEWNDPVRLERVAFRMKRAGFPVTAVLHRRFPTPRPLEDAVPPLVAGNRIDIELHNPTGRRWLLDAIADSKRSLCLQVYMGVDDDIGRRVGAVLTEAGRRGVVVRVLVDSLHGWHGSFGTENPLFQRLSDTPGVEVRTFRPVNELPTLKDLKQRNHCKLVLADGSLALVGGRNLSHEYYTGFEEARLGPRSRWREVPWLDASLRLEGPAVAEVGRAFLAAWTEAGGAPFELPVPAPAGSHAARVVTHRGLRDARILETYLEMIESARSHVYVVNGFPLLLELQHALLGAVRRRVRVCVLSGHLLPTHSGGSFDGAWSSGRTTATEFVHSRLDALVEAGAEAYFFAQTDVAGWDPALGVVQPHVHAKVLSVDGARCTVGSANFDVTSSYWESELVVLVEDADVTRALEARIDELVAGSVRCRAEDPVWQRLAARRAWMRKWPGVLSL